MNRYVKKDGLYLGGISVGDGPFWVVKRDAIDYIDRTWCLIDGGQVEGLELAIHRAKQFDAQVVDDNDVVLWPLPSLVVPSTAACKRRRSWEVGKFLIRHTEGEPHCELGTEKLSKDDLGELIKALSEAYGVLG